MDLDDERGQLVDLARKIIEGAGSEEEIDAWVDELQSRVPHPNVTDLIFHADRDSSPEEVIELALGYRPVQL